MTRTTLAVLGIIALAAPAFADNGPIPMRDERQPPTIQQQAAERPQALTGSQRSASEWTRSTQSVGGWRNMQTIYTR
jgi:hypothetical protein